ncbi:hypothetical protein [Acinetobacter sp. ANC 3882]|uniref:hypothetical protein n=1 Tax=Acinetobacter sp. ANC 3882 TaxID=2923423 RepID=UPI001F4AFFA3|nr:hypothetical protein [Acinetobacter sp. ANC 3882]MCH7312873.1 hypothetical protein [Acinetobacter sp. ANC 3882]
MSLPTLESFLKDVATHELTVNLDQGMFRDLTVSKPNSSCYHYNITTRAGYLIITGDMGTYVFKRSIDMFGFFRDENSDYEINPYYWAEKLEAGEFEKYSPDAARKALNFHFENWKECSYASEEKIKEEKESLDWIDTDDYFEFMEAVRNWSPSKNGVQLDDFWESNLNEYTYHYIWCLYAIVHAIKLYDAYKAEQGENQ